MTINNETADLVTYVEPTFHIADYIVFSLFLCISSAVGVFFSCRGQRNTKDYFLGGKQMNAIATGISTGVSFMSAGSIVGIPAEMNTHGYSYIIGTLSGSIGYGLGCVTVAYLLQPMQITSVNEYITKRFRSKSLTYTANVIVLLCVFQYMGACMLGSVIAFHSITGGQVSIILALVVGGVVGIFYTTIGGLKAVIWTDVIQSAVMLAGVIVVIIKPILDTPGGMTEIWRLNKEYGRIHEPVWSLDMTIRHTMWGLMFGMFFSWGVWCIQPACVQRLCSTKSKKDSYIVSLLAASIFFSLSFLPFWAGMNIFGYYISRGCDVSSTGWIKKNDIVIYYVRERLAYPGFQGLFLAALYAGSLSSLSSGLNSASAILWKDTIKPLLKKEISEAKATFISKIIVVVFGVLAMIWCYTLYSFGGLIIQVCASIDASMYGAYFGLFLFGILCRYASPAGGIAGLLVSFAITLWLGLGNLLYGKTQAPKMPTRTDRCAVDNTSSTTTNPLHLMTTVQLTPSTEPLMPFTFTNVLYSVSYVWLTLICIIISMIVSLVVTGCFGTPKKTLKTAHLVMPFCRPRHFKCLRENRYDVTDDSDLSPSFLSKPRNYDEN